VSEKECLNNSVKFAVDFVVDGGVETSIDTLIDHTRSTSWYKLDEKQSVTKIQLNNSNKLPHLLFQFGCKPISDAIGLSVYHCVAANFTRFK
jgi:hypothetical protein